MTVLQIQNKAEIQKQIHDAARIAVEAIEAAAKAIEQLGGDADEARETITSLITDEE